MKPLLGSCFLSSSDLFNLEFPFLKSNLIFRVLRCFCTRSVDVFIFSGVFFSSRSFCFLFRSFSFMPCSFCRLALFFNFCLDIAFLARAASRCIFNSSVEIVCCFRAYASLFCFKSLSRFFCHHLRFLSALVNGFSFLGLSMFLLTTEQNSERYIL